MKPLQKVAASHQTHQRFFQMAIEITRHHHERFDGEGYPDRLAGNVIPLAARILAIADASAGQVDRSARTDIQRGGAVIEIELAREGQGAGDRECAAGINEVAGGVHAECAGREHSAAQVERPAGDGHRRAANLPGRLCE